MNALAEIESIYRAADDALDNNDAARAASLFRRLVRREPKEPLFRWKLGYALVESKKFDRAVDELRRAIRLDPKNVAAWGCLGRAFVGLQKWPAAEDAFRRRLSFKESPQQYVFLANVLVRRKKYADAAQCCEQAIVLDPSFGEAYLNLGVARRHLGQLKKASAAFERAIELDPNYSVAHRELGMTHLKLGDTTAARSEFVKCLDADPTDQLCVQMLRTLVPISPGTRVASSKNGQRPAAPSSRLGRSPSRSRPRRSSPLD